MPDSLLLILASIGAQAIIAAALFVVLFWYANAFEMPGLKTWAWSMVALLVSLVGTGAAFSLAFDDQPVGSAPRLLAVFASQLGVFLHLALIAIGSTQFTGGASLVLTRKQSSLIFLAILLLAVLVSFSFSTSEHHITYRLVARIGVHYCLSAAVLWIIVLRLSRVRSSTSSVLRVSFFLAALLQSLILLIFFIQLYTGKSFGGRIFPFVDLLTLVAIAFGLVFWLLHLERGNVNTARSALSRLSNFDALTGAANQDYLLQLTDAAIQTGRPNALLVIDLDHFRSLGDALGRMQASALIQAIAQRIARCVSEQAVFARLKHDTFAILQPAAETIDFDSLSDQIHGVLAPPFHIKQRQLYLTASIGISLFPADAVDADSLLRAALLAVNQGKTLGRGQTRFYANSLNTAADARLGMLADLRQALTQNEFVLHYQPIFKQDGSLSCFETLLRWQHPERGLLAPDQFIELLQAASIYGAVDRMVLRRSLTMLSGWRKRFAMPLSIAVNISASSFQSVDFVTTVQRMLNEFSVPAANLVLEITESTMLDDVERAIDVLTQLKKLGVQVALDDFGTGYSSLSHLRSLPISQVKIDRSFVKDLPADPISAAIVAAIIQLSHKLGLSVVAEGIETHAQRQCLVSESVDYLQGFLLGSPMSAEAVETLLQDASSYGNFASNS